MLEMEPKGSSILATTVTFEDDDIPSGIVRQTGTGEVAFSAKDAFMGGRSVTMGTGSTSSISTIKVSFGHLKLFESIVAIMYESP